MSSLAFINPLPMAVSDKGCLAFKSDKIVGADPEADIKRSPSGGFDSTTSVVKYVNPTLSLAC